MSMRSHHFEFLKPMQTVHDLDIPQTPPGIKEGQQLDMPPGDHFEIYCASRKNFGRFVAKRWMQIDDKSLKMIELTNIGTNTTLFLTNWQLLHLMKAGRLAHLSPNPRNHMIPGSGAMLSEKQRAYAHKWMAIIDAYHEVCVAYGTDRLPQHIVRAILTEKSAELGLSAPPGLSTFYEMLARDRGSPDYDRLVKLSQKSRAGNQTQRFSSEFEAALKEAVEAAWSDPKGTWKTVVAYLVKIASPGEAYAHIADQILKTEVTLRMSDRTVQERFRNVPFFTRDYLRFGPEYAERVHASYIRKHRPNAPLEVVDVDHTTLNVVVFDDALPISFGRPDLILFRDRYSGVVIGYSISFGPPSFATFLDGLMHACMPKDPATLPAGCSYPWYGFPRRLGVDNASHFIGGTIHNAARELGFQIVEYRPGRPMEKGALEHLFAILNLDVVNRLPGSTTSSPTERGKFDDEKEKAQPNISLRELKGFLDWYFSEIYHRQSHVGLGELVTLSGVPADLWADGIKNAPFGPIIDEAIFVRLAGETTMVTIQADGIRWDYIHYNHADLIALTTHPDHKKGTRAHSATKYRAMRDPNDLGSIWIHDPYQGRVISVPVIDVEAKYANGLKLYQHRRIMEYRREQKLKTDSIEDLLKSMHALQNQLVELHRQRQKHDTAAKLARFVSSQSAKIRRSMVIDVEAVRSDSERINLAEPAQPTPPAKSSPRTMGLLPAPSPEAENPVPVPDFEVPSPLNTPDIADIRARNSDWED